MTIARDFNLKGAVIRDRTESCSRATTHELPRTRSTVEVKNAGCEFRMGKRHEAHPGVSQPEPGNRQLSKGNPKTRSLLRVDSLKPQLESPVIPALSIVPLAAVSSVRVLHVHQSASEESV